MSNKTKDVLIVSESKLLTNGLRKILESEISIRVIAELSNLKQVKAFMEENEPDYVFLDQRVKDPVIEKFLLSKKIKSKGIQIILLSDEDSNGPSPESFITMNQDTSALDLIDIIKNGREIENVSVMEKRTTDENEISVTRTESRIINLVTSGSTNKEIAEKLGVSEKTIKAHITNIFTKLNIQNRYQLMVYGRRHQKKA